MRKKTSAGAFSFPWWENRDGKRNEEEIEEPRAGEDRFLRE
jgi:hypothetical protein